MNRLILALMLLAMLLIACVVGVALMIYDPMDACLDGGGRWVEEAQVCDCSDEQRGTSAPMSPEEYETCRYEPSELPHS